MAIHPRTILVGAFRRYEKDNHAALRADPIHKAEIKRARQAIREGAHTLIPAAVATLALPKDRIVAILRWWEKRHLGEQGSGRKESDRCGDLADRVAQGETPAIDSWMLLQAIRGVDLIAA